jgi:RNA recognition motif-containing protein
MFVDSLTRSITGNESASILDVESSEEGSISFAPQVATPTSQISFAEEQFHRSTTNLSTISNQTGYEGGSSTVMLRNVPYDARQHGVLALVEEEGFKGQFDFFYAPLDFKSKNNLGYAFINFKSIDIAKSFFRHFDGKRVSASSRPGWDKPLRVCWARVQSLDANVEHYRNSPVNEMPPEFKPMLFDTDGNIVPFPAPDTGREESRHSALKAGGSVSTVRPRERRLQSQLSRGFLTPDNAGIGKASSAFGSKTPQPSVAGRKLFVGGLGPDTTSEQLEKYMKRFGEVSDCNVLLDAQTGRSRCYAFCTFSDEEGAQAALAFPKIHLVDGRGVVVRPYTSTR